MGRHHNGRPFTVQLFHQFHHLRRHLRIQTGGGLVHDKDLRTHGEDAGYGDPLPLAVGETHYPALPEILHPHHEQGFLDPPLDLVLGKTQILRSERHVLFHDRTEQHVVGVLEQHGDVGAHPRHALPAVRDGLSVVTYDA